MIGAVVGLLTLLCALVTGLLIWTAYGVYAGQNAAIQTLASRVLQLDLALADYGPEGTPCARAYASAWARPSIRFGELRESDANFAANNFAAAIRIMRDPEKALGKNPALDGRAEAGARHGKGGRPNSISQSRLQCPSPCGSCLLSPLADRDRLGVCLCSVHLRPR